MNVLAEKQKRIFEDGITDLERLKRKKEFLILYKEMREKNDKRFYSKLSLEQRKKLHKLILLIYKIKNKLGGFSFELIKDERNLTDRPIIFAVTHVGKFDIEVISESIKDHYYLLSGDFEHIQGIIDAPFIALNGVIYFNEKDKEDRKSASNRMINHLKQHGNLMYFPEGTWNLSSNLPVLPCYWGIINVARESDAIIIPVAADQYDKHFKINIGKSFDVLKYDNNLSGKANAIKDLRDEMATLKWEIWETERVSRNEIKSDEWEKYIEDRLKEWPYFNENYIKDLIFKPKNVVESSEVYDFFEKMIPNEKNAFLYNKRLKGKI